MARQGGTSGTKPFQGSTLPELLAGGQPKTAREPSGPLLRPPSMNGLDRDPIVALAWSCLAPRRPGRFTTAARRAEAPRCEPPRPRSGWRPPTWGLGSTLSSCSGAIETREQRDVDATVPEQVERVEEILEADVVRGERAGIVGGETRAELPHPTRLATVHGGIDQKHVAGAS